MNWESGFTIIAVIWIAILVILTGAGGYVLTKSIRGTSEVDSVVTSENASDSERDIGTSANEGEDGLISETSSGSEDESAQSTLPLLDNIIDTINTEPDSETVEGVRGLVEDTDEGSNEGSEPMLEPALEPAPDPEPTSDPESTPESVEDAEGPGSNGGNEGGATSQTVTVTYENSGFSPGVVTISQGEAVLFVNNSNHGMWVGSDSHPTHTRYPEKSGSDCLGSSFDSCINIDPGSSWQFLFTSVGSWGYHNHTRIGRKGTIIVQ